MVTGKGNRKNMFVAVFFLRKGCNWQTVFCLSQFALESLELSGRGRCMRHYGDAGRAVHDFVDIFMARFVNSSNRGSQNKAKPR